MDNMPDNPLESLYHSVPLGFYRGDNYSLTSSPLFEEVKSGGLPKNQYFRVGGIHSTVANELFTKQAATLEDLLERQKLIAEQAMLNLPEFAHVRQDFDRASKFTRAHAFQMERIRDPDHRGRYPIFTPRIEIHSRHAQRDDKGRFIDDGHPVWGFKQVITDSADAAKEFVVKHQGRFPEIAKAVHFRAAVLPDARFFDPQKYLGAKGRPGKIRKHLDTQLAVDAADSKLAELTEVVVRGFDMRPVKVNGSDRIEVKGLTHAKFLANSQEPHDFTVADKPVALTGRNGAGKTHLLEALGLAVTSAGSVAAATVRSGNIKPVSQLVAEYRPGGGRFGLSSFGIEAQTWGQVITWLEGLQEGRKLILSDEPFSTTDPHEQDELVRRLFSYLTRLGAQIVFTTHSDISPMVDSGEVQAFHLEAVGNRSRVLKEGIGDAESIAEAEKRGLNPDIIARAKDIYQGSGFSLDEINEEPIVESKSLKEGFKGNPGLGWFMDRSPVGKPGTDGESYAERFMRRELAEQIEPTKCNFVFGDDNLLHLDWSSKWVYGERSNPLSDMLQDRSTTNEGDLALRQDFFQRLAAYEHSPELSGLLNKLQDVIFGLSEHCFRVGNSDDRQNFYSGANPSIDPGLSMLTILKDAAGAKVGQEYHHSDTSDEKQELLVEIARCILEYFGTDLSPNLAAVFEEYIELVGIVKDILSDGDRRTVNTVQSEYGDYKRVTMRVEEDVRDRLYSFCQKVHALSGENEDDEDDDVGRKGDVGFTDFINIDTKGADYYLRSSWNKLSEVFFDIDYEQYDHKTGTYSSRIYKPRSSVNPEEFESVMQTFFGYRAHDGLIGHIISGLGRELSTNLDLGLQMSPSNKEVVDRLKAAVIVAGEARVRLHTGYMLTAMQFLYSEEDLLGEIAGHFRAVGGEIAKDLSEYIDKNYRDYFMGAKSGQEYLAQIRRDFIGRRQDLIKQARENNSRNRDRESSRAKKGKEAPVRRSDIYRLYLNYDKYRRSTSKKSWHPLHELPVLSDGGYNSKVPTTIYSDAELIRELVTIAIRAKEEGYSRPSEAGILSARSLKHQVMFDGQVPTWFELDTKGGIDVISGSNMSGKTHFGKNVFMNLALARAFCLVPSEGFTAPRYDKVVYIDRPNQDPGKGLSSFMADVENWKKALEVLDKAAPSFVFIDEPFSSAPSKYQEALLLASLEWLAARGHRVVVATHNHEAIEKLQIARENGKSAAPITFHHLQSTAIDDGGIEFSRQFNEGVAASMAAEVAKLIGGAALAKIFA